jgi:hypothetical protein
LKQAYEYVIRQSGSRSKIYHLPKLPTILAMKAFHAIGLSPLGPYHYGMIAEEFVFDISKVQNQLGWQPTLENGEMLFQAYDHYVTNRGSLAAGSEGLSAHQRSSRLGVIKLLKWIS